MAGFDDYYKAKLQAALGMASAPAATPAPEGAPPPDPNAPPQGSMLGGLTSIVGSPKAAYEAATNTGLAALNGMSVRDVPQALAAPGGPSAAPSPEVVDEARRQAYEDKLVNWTAAKTEKDKAEREGFGGGVFAQPHAAGGPGGGGGGVAPANGGYQWAISPEAQKAADKAEAAAEGAVGVDRDIAVGNAEAGRKMYQRQGLEKQLEGTKEQWAEAHRQTKADAFAQGLADEQERYANMRVDPRHFWSSQNTGQKILIGLAQAVANFGAGFSGHPERVNADLNHLIDRDIDAQKENIAHAGNSLNAKRGVYAEMLRKFGDERQAELAAKQLMLDRMDTEAKTMAMATGSQTAIAKAAKEIAALQAQHADRIAREQVLPKPKGGDSSKIAADLKWQAEHTEAPQQVVDTTSAAARDLGTESGQTAAGIGFNTLSGVPVLGHLIYGNDVYTSDQKFKLAVAKGASELGRGNPAMTQYWVDLADKAHSPEARQSLLVNMQQMAQSQLRSVSGGVMPESNQAYQATKAINAPAAPQNTPSFTLKPPGSGSR